MLWGDAKQSPLRTSADHNGLRRGGSLTNSRLYEDTYRVLEQRISDAIKNVTGQSFPPWCDRRNPKFGDYSQRHQVRRQKNRRHPRQLAEQ
jgi:hypothetical protein